MSECFNCTAWNRQFFIYFWLCVIYSCFVDVVTTFLLLLFFALSLSEYIYHFMYTTWKIYISTAINKYTVRRYCAIDTQLAANKNTCIENRFCLWIQNDLKYSSSFERTNTAHDRLVYTEQHINVIEIDWIVANGVAIEEMANGPSIARIQPEREKERYRKHAVVSQSSIDICIFNISNA